MRGPPVDSIRDGVLALLTQPRPWGVPLKSTADDRLVGRRATEPASNAVQRLILGPTVAGSQRTERTRLRTTVAEFGSGVYRYHLGSPVTR